MKTISAVALCAALGFAAAGCASGSNVRTGSVTVAVRTTTSTLKTGTVVRSKVFRHSIVVSGTVTVSNLTAGTVVGCKGSQLTATVPDGTEEVAEGGHWSNSAVSQNMNLTRLQNGMVTISCSS
jgi:hypothetical protein